jgi:hypothetical protein
MGTLTPLVTSAPVRSAGPEKRRSVARSSTTTGPFASTV